jgi:hypothetical protein
MASSGANVGFLFLAERASLGIREMRKRYRGQVKMRFDELCGRWDRNVGMNIDCHALRPQLASRSAVAAGGGWRVFVPLLRHAYSSFGSAFRRGSYRLTMKIGIRC